MAKKTKVQIAVETTGSKKAAKEMESIGRQQTRLGQASASAGRQFSAQASGLGGLVSAYAGAAATIFALSAAFDALNKAARAEQTLAGVNALANSIGESGPKILDMIQRITKGQLSLVQAAELANLALSSGFSSEQLAGFTEVAMRASRALGRDLTDSFQRLVRGAVKLEPELLDELGIFTRIEPAAEAYAASVGKVASQLSRFEKRQAFANKVAADGAEKYRDIDIEADTAAQSLEKLAATVSDLATNVGGVIARALAPLAEALSSPVAAIGVMGILIKTVFGTALREATQRLSSFNANLRTSSDNLQDNLSSTKRIGAANLEFSNTMKGVSLNVARASAANEQEFKSLTKKAKAQTITTAETRRYNQIIKEEIRALEREKLALESSGKATATKAARIGVLERRITQFTLAQTAANTRLKAFGPIAKAAGAAAIGLGRAIGVAGSVALAAVSWISLIVTTLSILISIGGTVLEAFGWLDVVIEKTQLALRYLKEIFNITKEIAQASTAFKRLESGITDATKINIGRVGSSKVATIFDADDLRDALDETIEAGGSAGFQTASSFVDAYKDAIGSSSPKIVAFAKELFKKVGQETGGTLRGRTLFAEATGRSGNVVDRQLEVKDNALTFREINDIQGSILAKERARFVLAKAYNDTSKEQKELLKLQDEFATSQLQTQELSVNLNEILTAGTGTIEAIEKRRGALLSKEANLRKEANDLIDRSKKTTGEIAKGLVEQAKARMRLADATKEEVLFLDTSAQMQLGILKIRNKIRETYGAQIKASEKLQEFYRIELENGKAVLKLNTNADQKRAARFQQLKATYDLGAEALKQERAFLAGVEGAEKVVGDDKQRADAARAAQQAITGQFIQSLEAAIKLKDTIEKQLDTMKKQTDQLKQQAALKKIEREIADVKTQISLTKEQASMDERRVASLAKIAQLKREARDIDRRAAQDRAKDIAAEFGDLLSPKKQRALELRIARADLAALQANIEAEKKLIKDRDDITQAAITEQIRLQRKLLDTPEGEPGLLKKRFEQQKKMDEKKIANDKATRDLNIASMKARKDSIIEEVKMRRTHVEEMAKVLAADVVNRAHILNKDERLSDPQFRKDFMQNLLDTGFTRSPIQQQINDIDKVLGTGFKDLEEQSRNLATAERGIKQQERRVNLQNAEEEVTNRINQLTEQGLEATRQRTAAELTLENQLKEGTKTVNNLAAKFRDADNEMLQLAKDVASSLSGGVAQGLRDLNQAMIEGTLTMENFKQGFKDTFLNIAKDIQGKIFDKMVVKPVENFINEQVLGLFGFGPDKKIEDALVPSAGGTAVLVTMAPSATGANPTALLQQQSNAAAANINKLGTSSATSGNFLEQMFSKVGTVLGDFGNALLDAGKGVFDFVGSLFQGLGSLGGGGGGGIGGFFSGIFSGIGDFFGSIFGGGSAIAPTVGVPVSPSILPPTIMFAAHGGLVRKMAAGGMLRDRVPAMLEPGEFVVRKPMAKAIGGPALNAMNAHGTMPNSPNVVVNMNNQGTPQESEGKPNVQVTPEAIIVDIVTRDMQNNGPIRRSIRGNLS